VFPEPIIESRRLRRKKKSNQYAERREAMWKVYTKSMNYLPNLDDVQIKNPLNGRIKN